MLVRLSSRGADAQALSARLPFPPATLGPEHETQAFASAAGQALRELTQRWRAKLPGLS